MEDWVVGVNEPEGHDRLDDVPDRVGIGGMETPAREVGLPDGDCDVLVADIARVPEDLVTDLGLGLDVHKHSAVGEMIDGVPTCQELHRLGPREG